MANVKDLKIVLETFNIKNGSRVVRRVENVTHDSKKVKAIENARAEYGVPICKGYLGKQSK